MLDNIPRKQVFRIPERYFETLPGRVQSRIGNAKNDRVMRTALLYSLRYAIPLVLLLFVLLAVFRRPPASDSDAVTILASVETADMIEYLNETGLSSDEIMETIYFNASDLEAIENEVFKAGAADIDEADLIWTN